MRNFAPAELNDRLRGLSNPGQKMLTLQSLWQRLAQFDTRDEVLRELGANSLEWRGLQEVTNALTSESDGSRLRSHNEVKINNPTLAGIGILRQGRPVYLENADSADLQRLTGNVPAPDWLVQDGSAVPPNTVTVPQSVWQEAQRRNLPLVALD